MAGKNTYYGGIYGAREWSINADTANTAIDLSQSNVYNISLSANTTISFLNPTSTHYIFVIEQTVGSNTITWPDIKWKSGVPPTLSTTIGSKDTISIIYDGEEYYGFSSADYQTGFRLLDYYPDAAAAYSLRDLSQEWIGQPVVRVRRSSDNAERDFTSAEITDGTLLTWVNTEVVKYASDFSATEDLFESNGTGAANIDGIAGVDDTYRFTLTGGAVAHNAFFVINNTQLVSKSVRVSLDYYIPSSNSLLTYIRLTDGGIGGELDTLNILDAWTSVSYEHTMIGDDLRFEIPAAIGSADGDVFYTKNIVVTQTTADGHVVTWYDQSGNGNDATQATAANQPKIVDAGVLVEENGKPAIDFDGVDDLLSAGDILSGLAILNVFTVSKIDSSNGFDDIYNKGIGTFGDREYGLIINAGMLIVDEDLDTTSLASSTTPANQFLAYSGYDALNVFVGIDGAALSTNTALTVRDQTSILVFMGSALRAFNNRSDGNIQEAIFYDTDQSANRTAIEQNINEHYSIYT